MSETETIREDVIEEGEETVEAVEETAETPEEESKPLSPRDEVVQRIREKRDQEIKADMGVEEPEEEPEAPEEPEEEETAEIVEEPEEQPELVTIKVDGVEQQIPKDKIYEMGVRTAQKESSADYRLRQLALRQKELDQREAKVRELLEQHSQEAPKQEIKGRKEAFAKALIEDEDQAAEMYAESLERVAQLEAKFGELAQQTQQTQQYVQESKAQRATNLVNLFKREYPHLAQERELMEMANNRTVELMHENPDMSQEDIILQAGRDVEAKIRDMFGMTEEKTEEPDPRTTKRKMPKPAKKLAGKRPPKEEPKPQTKSDIIADMARRRQPY